MAQGLRLPLDFGLVMGVRTWPAGGLAYGMSALVGTCLGVFRVVCLQGLDGVGYGRAYAKPAT